MHKRLKFLARGELAFVAALGAGMALTAPASAHHALESTYDTANESEVTAVLTRVDWINPHAWFRFDLRYSNGVVENNVLHETVGIAGLRLMGIAKDSLKIGAAYQITYYPNRDGKPGGFVTRLVLPDGSMLGEPASEPDSCSGQC
jgi:hypothetical protein